MHACRTPLLPVHTVAAPMPRRSQGSLTLGDRARVCFGREGPNTLARLAVSC